jgi:hypothetical protein
LGYLPHFVLREMVNMFRHVGYFSISWKSICMKVYTLAIQFTGHDPDKLHNSMYLISWVISPILYFEKWLTCFEKLDISLFLQRAFAWKFTHLLNSLQVMILTSYITLCTLFLGLSPHFVLKVSFIIDHWNFLHSTHFFSASDEHSASLQLHNTPAKIWSVCVDFYAPGI